MNCSNSVVVSGVGDEWKSLARQGRRQATGGRLQRRLRSMRLGWKTWDGDKIRSDLSGADQPLGATVPGPPSFHPAIVLFVSGVHHCPPFGWLLDRRTNNLLTRTAACKQHTSMDDFNSESDSDYTSYWRDWVRTRALLQHNPSCTHARSTCRIRKRHLHWFHYLHQTSI
jgi:hypothetical protein